MVTIERAISIDNVKEEVQPYVGLLGLEVEEDICPNRYVLGAKLIQGYVLTNF
jgi:hypothetical protein